MYERGVSSLTRDDNRPNLDDAVAVQRGETGCVPVSLTISRMVGRHKKFNKNLWL
jgi:hypothetical protein